MLVRVAALLAVCVALNLVQNAAVAGGLLAPSVGSILTTTVFVLLNIAVILWNAQSLRQTETERTSVISAREELRLLEGMIQKSTQPFVIVSTEGRLIRWNGAFEQLTGYSFPELCTLSTDDLTPEPWRPNDLNLRQQLLTTGKSVVYEKEYRQKSGAIVPVELFIDVYRDESLGETFFMPLSTTSPSASAVRSSSGWRSSPPPTAW
jgi:PAS domain S-box-containing protein